MRSLELFAGAGGLGMGLHAAGFHPTCVFEWDSDSCETIRRNKVFGHSTVKDWNLSEGDVRDVDFRKYEGKIELVSGGPPCQPFSMGGKHQAYDDLRDMFPQAIRAVYESKPQAFIFENVKGLTRSTFRNYFEYIRLRLQYPEIHAKRGEEWGNHLARLERHHTSGSVAGLRYRLVTQVVNAADYGVPQRRERVFFVGFRTDLGVQWSFPRPTHSSESLILDQISGRYWERHQVAKKDRCAPSFARDQPSFTKSLFPKLPWQTVRDAIGDLADPERHTHSVAPSSNHRFQPGARSYKGHTGSPLDEPAKTLKAGVHGVPGGENMLLRANGKVRYFTVRESARLQTFPDDFIFAGSWTESMRQLGNAVPVRLAQIVGQDVARHLTMLL